MIGRITQLFPAWAVLFAVLAYISPNLFVGLKAQIVPLLTCIMLAMGISLSPKDFINVAQHKKAVGIGVILQFLIMPVTALLISFLLGFSTELTVGMVLVGSVAGGTSSNVMAFLAKGNVALSISMTAISTLLGVIVTPVLVELLLGQTVDVPVSAMLISLVKIVLLPVSIGLVINTFAHKAVDKIHSLLPLISMVAIVLIIAIVVALNANNLSQIGPVVALAVILHNGIGLTAGYYSCRLLGFEESTCRTIAFEVGLQNSGLATALAMKFFSPASAIAGTLFSVWHNISGSLLAGYWASKQNKHNKVSPAC
ncbi:bile acid:sodium symporter family protein [Photobacterium gaetbulicola]|uniref:Bile acid:sodium symporter n=1 Tax=Photobacterium gaetbulicola Gung47 TaxID=658445 RepID=A0A0C5W3N2_9GAMM|nr:bile acid:sodium symporter family protein [Photobacterium gaetbulicola]AJR06076.1 bile acid:sodium symporter [Photobacterium gaetbulicola Gung47]PSU02733.1 bile acid:sodium symporter family protein [Photobacterium gaetbulicola]